MSAYYKTVGSACSVPLRKIESEDAWCLSGETLLTSPHREQTVYYAKVFKEDLGRGLEILSDILINSLLDEGAVHRERDVIIREMEEVNKQQEEVLIALKTKKTAREDFKTQK